MHLFFHACSVLMFLIIIAISIHSIIILGSKMSKMSPLELALRAVKMSEAPNGAFSHGAIVGRIWDQTVLIFVGENMGKAPEMPWFNTGAACVFWPLFLSEMAILMHPPF